MTIEDLIAKAKPVCEVVNMPRLGITATVSEMTGEQYERFERGAADNKERLDFRVRLVAACTTNGDGQPLFPADQLDRINREIGIGTLQPLFDAAVRLNRLSKRDRDELEKN